MLLTIGYIVAAHGIRGEVKMRYVTDRPELLPEIDHVYFDDDPTPIPIEGARRGSDGKHAILKLGHVTTRNDAEALRGTVIRARGDQLPELEEGAFYYYQVLGLQTYTEEDELLGEVTEIIHAGEVDVYVVTDANGKQQLFPALPDVVLEINPSAGRMLVRPQTWED